MLVAATGPLLLLIQ